MTSHRCRRAADEHEHALMAITGVVGVGVGRIEVNGHARCCVNVYTAGPDVGELPRWLTVSEARATVNVPVQVIDQGVLEL